MPESLLLDEFIPTWDHEISMSQLFRAPPAEVFDAITNLDLYRLPLTRVLLEARGLPARLADAVARRRGEKVAPEPPTFRVRDLPARGWLLLGERPGVELVYGTVARLTGAPDAPERPVTAETFAGFAAPGFIKLAENTRVDPHGARACVLTFETRVLMTDAASRKAFRRYWAMAGPFVRLMRPVAMRAITRQLEQRPTPTSGASGRAGVRTRLENALDRHSVRVGAWVLWRTRGRAAHLWHRRALVLTTTGRKSGLPRTVVVQYFPDGEDLIVVAANSGMPTDPAWFLNLTARPEALVEVDGRRLSVRAEQLRPEEVAAWWPRVLAVAPDYARFRERTDRPIPMLRLVPVGDGPPRGREPEALSTANAASLHARGS